MEDARTPRRPEEDILPLEPDSSVKDKIFVIYASSSEATPSSPSPPIDTPPLPPLPLNPSTSTTSKRIVAAQSAIVTYKAGLEDAGMFSLVNKDKMQCSQLI